MKVNPIVDSLFKFLTGYQVIVTTIKVQNRKHHKSRINKKWAKRYGFTYYDCQSQDIVMVDRTIYVTQNGYEMLLKAIQNGGEQWQSELMIKDSKN